MSSSIAADQIRHIGRLARLRFAPEELAEFTAQFNRILGYVEKLNQARTEGVEPMRSVFERTVELRPDEPGPMLSQRQALSNAPRKTEGFFSVPKVIEG